MGRFAGTSSRAIEIPQVLGHPNRLPFEGCLTLVDVISDSAPTGARGHRVMLSSAVAEKALGSLMGMAISFRSSWDGHDTRQKCGIITHAHLDGPQLLVGGFVFAKDFPECAERTKGDDLGMSYEMADVHIADCRAAVWTVTKACFTGAAVLQRSKAAYRATFFRIVDLSERPKARRYGKSRLLSLFADPVDDDSSR